MFNVFARLRPKSRIAAAAAATGLAVLASVSSGQTQADAQVIVILPSYEVMCGSVGCSGSSLPCMDLSFDLEPILDAPVTVTYKCREG